MTLSAGTYEVLTPLGAGGMGEVCRARDTRLGREVAFAHLEKAFAERSHGMTFLTTDPNLDDLRRDPGFSDLVRRVGLVPVP
jgi:serine/threonine protein kinase